MQIPLGYLVHVHYYNISEKLRASNHRNPILENEECSISNHLMKENKPVS